MKPNPSRTRGAHVRRPNTLIAGCFLKIYYGGLLVTPVSSHIPLKLFPLLYQDFLVVRLPVKPL